MRAMQLKFHAQELSSNPSIGEKFKSVPRTGLHYDAP